MLEPQTSSRPRAGAWLLIGSCGLPLLALTPAGADPLLVMPLDCIVGQSCAIQHYVDQDPSAGARDYTCGSLTYDGHNGTDFRLASLAVQRKGVDVLAAASGQIARLRDGEPDTMMSSGSEARAQGRECGNGVIISHENGWETQYCHLAQGSVRVRPGDRVVAGQPIGRVGLSGQTEFPHLHFTVRHNGQVVDPFAYDRPAGTCDGGASLWNRSLESLIAYRARTVLNVGFASKQVTMAMIESGEADEKPWRADAAAMVAFVRAIGLKAGDVQRLSIKAPDLSLIADYTAAPLDRNKAQWMLFAGVRRPAAGWSLGRYTAEYLVSHDRQVVLQQSFVLEP